MKHKKLKNSSLSDIFLNSVYCTEICLIYYMPLSDCTEDLAIETIKMITVLMSYGSDAKYLSTDYMTTKNIKCIYSTDSNNFILVERDPHSTAQSSHAASEGLGSEQVNQVPIKEISLDTKVIKIRNKDYLHPNLKMMYTL
jgi:hypothetical protein